MKWLSSIAALILLLSLLSSCQKPEEPLSPNAQAIADLLIEELGADEFSASLTARALDSLGVKEIIDMQVRKVEILPEKHHGTKFYHCVQITDAEQNEYSFTLSEYGSLGGYVYRGDRLIWAVIQ